MRRLMAPLLVLGLWQAFATSGAAQLPRKKTPEEIKKQLADLRKKAQTSHWTFQIGRTRALERRLARLAGTRVPANAGELVKKANAVARKLLAFDKKAADKFATRHPGQLPARKLAPRTQHQSFARRRSFDWRTYHKITPIRDQGSCGSCWDFSALAAFESSYAIRNNLLIHASEQDVLDHSGPGSCSGGWWMDVFKYLIRHGTTLQTGYPYKGTKGKHKSVSGPYRAVAWGFVHQEGSIPSVQEVKEALCQRGPLTVGVYATHAFQAYTGGVFNEHAQGKVNHGVCIIGWDDGKGKKGSWLIKNSWSTGWGEKGYMWIEYGCNRIGDHAAWVRARSVYYKLPAAYFKVVPNMKPHLPLKALSAAK